MFSIEKFKNAVVDKANLAKQMVMESVKNTLGLLNTILEGLMVFLVGGAMYLFTYVMTGEVMVAAAGITGLPACVTTGMNQGETQILGGLQLMGIVFMVVGLIIVIRAFLSIYGQHGGSKY